MPLQRDPETAALSLKPGQKDIRTSGKLQYPVRVEKPSPRFARMLQQAIDLVEGEIQVALQYFFQAWGNSGPQKYREMLLSTATEEISHIEMLSTAVALRHPRFRRKLPGRIQRSPRSWVG